jgi:hypothetical protein
MINIGDYIYLGAPGHRHIFEVLKVKSYSGGLLLLRSIYPKLHLGVFSATVNFKKLKVLTAEEKQVVKILYE